MKRVHEEDAHVHSVKRMRMAAESGAGEASVFSILPLELLLHNIIPATGRPYLARVLMGLTCRDAAKLLLGDVYGGRDHLLLVDHAILGGEEWAELASSMIASSKFRVSAMSTLDAIIVVDSTELLSRLCARYGDDIDLMAYDRDAIYDSLDWKQRNARPVYKSPLDMAAHCGQLRVATELQYLDYPRVDFGEFCRALGRHARHDMFESLHQTTRQEITEGSIASFACGVLDGGHVELSAMLARDHPNIANSLLKTAIRDRHAAIVRYFIEHRLDFPVLLPVATLMSPLTASMRSDEESRFLSIDDFKRYEEDMVWLTNEMSMLN